LPLSPEDAVADDDGRGVYGISVAAELSGLGVQNLRLYERRGLLEPDRTDGGTRRYSPNDVHRLRRISVLLADGLNLAGIAMVLGLESDNADLRAELDASRNRETGRSDQGDR
jgi:MerR family transcriptional regulator/heat shock protein HspR